MIWTLAAFIVGFGGIFLGAAVGVWDEPLGIWVMIASAIACYFLALMGGRWSPKKHKKDDD
jgi:hypothetical protein